VPNSSKPIDSPENAKGGCLTPTLDAAVANRQARIEGSARVLRRLPDLFDLATARR
jgi:hypothetical protein